MTRRITIGSDGVVRLHGESTRWRVAHRPGLPRPWRIHGPRRTVFYEKGGRAGAVAYLETLADEELMA